MPFLELLKLLLSLTPTIIQTVQAIEKAIPQKGAGAAKLDMVLSTVQAAADAAPIIMDGVQAVKTGDAAHITAGITSIVNATVATLNKTGVFQQLSD
jgi:hypothetical protein